MAIIVIEIGFCCKKRVGFYWPLSFNEGPMFVTL